MKTSELKGAALDWAVAKCEGKLPASYDDWKQTWPHYSTDWSQGGPIIDREKIEIRCNTLLNISEWNACLSYIGPHPRLEGRGPTPLIAAMRCYVASKLGDEVEVPEELCP